MCESNIEDGEITTNHPQGEMCEICSEDNGKWLRPEDEGKDDKLTKAYDEMKNDQENQCTGCDWWEMSLMAKGIDSWGSCHSPEPPRKHHLRFKEIRFRTENKKRIKEVITDFHPAAPYYGKTTWWNEFCDDQFKSK